MFLKYLTVLLAGFSGGILVSAGLFTLMISLGIITRLAQITKSAHLLILYENTVIFGTVTGILLWLYEPGLHFGAAGSMICGLFSGVYVGCLIGAIAEILDAFPIFFRRLSLKNGAQLVTAVLAAGKFLGVILQFLM